MNPIACQRRSWSTRLALWTVCGMALTSSAYAQSPFSPAQQVDLGMTMGVPLSAFGQMAAINSIKQKNLTFIALAQSASGAYNSNVAIVGVKNRNGTRTTECWVPTWALPAIKQINKTAISVEQQAAGLGNTNFAQIDVQNANFATVPAGTKFMFCPSWAVGSVLQVNTNVVVITQVAVGVDNKNVALVGITNSNKVKVPTAAAGDVKQINNNVVAINQSAVGVGNTNFAEVTIDNRNVVR